MRLVSKEIKLYNKKLKLFSPEIFVTVAIPPVKEESSQETEDEFYQRIGKQFVELLQKGAIRKRGET